MAAKQLTANQKKVVNDIVFNTLYSRSSFLRQFMDGEKRNLDTECGHTPHDEPISAQLLKNYYDREGIATRIVHVYPEGCWTEDPEVYEDEDPQVETAFEASWNRVVKKHNVWHYLQRIDALSGIGRYGAMLIGFNDGGKLQQPLKGVPKDGLLTANALSIAKNEQGNKNAPTRDITFLRTFDETCIDIASFEQDTSNPRFGQPLTYNIKLTNPKHHGSSAEPQLTMESASIHWSRVLHVADNCEGSEVFGVSRLQKNLNRLFDLRKLLGGSAEMFWKGAFPGLSFEMNPDLADPDLDVSSIRREVENYMNRLQRYIAIQGMQTKSLAPQVADPSMHIEVQLRAICIAEAVPYRIFQGSEEAKLASSQDMKTWNKRLANRQSKYLIPKLIRPFIDRLILAGVLEPPQVLDEYEIDFPDLNALSDIERIEVAGKTTEAMAKYCQGGVETLVPPLEFLTDVLGMDREQAESILEAAEEHVSELMDENNERTPQGATTPTPEPEPFTDPIELEAAKAEGQGKVAEAKERAKAKYGTGPQKKKVAPKKKAAPKKSPKKKG